MCADFSTYFPFDSLRVIPFARYSGIRNMSLDYLFTQKCEIDDIPILRFYGWKPYCLSIGRHQFPTEIDFESLKKNGYDSVRRPTGGSAIFHSEELTYSFLVPGRDLHHQEIYKFFHEQLKRAFRKMGINAILQESNQPYRLNENQETFACFNRSAFSEIQVGGKKITGSAQKIFKNSLLQHGSILLGKKHRSIVNFLKVDPASKKALASQLASNSTELSSVMHEQPNIDTLTKHILNAFGEVPGLQIFTEIISHEDIEKSKMFDEKFIISG